MTTAVIPDPQSFLPAMPPLVMVILHWIIVIVVGMAIVGAIGSLLGAQKEGLSGLQG